MSNFKPLSFFSFRENDDSIYLLPPPFRGYGWTKRPPKSLLFRIKQVIKWRLGSWKKGEREGDRPPRDKKEKKTSSSFDRRGKEKMGTKRKEEEGRAEAVMGAKKGRKRDSRRRFGAVFFWANEFLLLTQESKL